MSMTRQDYVQIAAILTETRTWARDRANTQPTIDHIARELADLMAAGNSKFNRATFYAATGMEPRNFPGFPAGTFRGHGKDWLDRMESQINDAVDGTGPWAKGDQS